MKSEVLTLIALLLFYCFCMPCCSNHPSSSHNTTSSKPGDADTFPDKKTKSKYQQEIDDGAPSFSDILDGVRRSYKDTIKLDTSFLSGGHDTIFVKFSHYCTFDNAIEVPLKYLKGYNLSKFQTHNFISVVEIRTSNTKSLYREIIRKSDFNTLLDDKLKASGVLSDPNVSFMDKKLNIEYSISIPLTDIGIGVNIILDTVGHRHVARD